MSASGTQGTPADSAGTQADRGTGRTSTAALAVWLLSDGAPGHLSQSRGIVDALVVTNSSPEMLRMLERQFGRPDTSNVTPVNQENQRNMYVFYDKNTRNEAPAAIAVPAMGGVKLTRGKRRRFTSLTRAGSMSTLMVPAICSGSFSGFIRPSIS